MERDFATLAEKMVVFVNVFGDTYTTFFENDTEEIAERVVALEDEGYTLICINDPSTYTEKGFLRQKRADPIALIDQRRPFWYRPKVKVPIPHLYNPPTYKLTYAEALSMTLNDYLISETRQQVYEIWLWRHYESLASLVYHASFRLNEPRLAVVIPEAAIFYQPLARVEAAQINAVIRPTDWIAQRRAELRETLAVYTPETSIVVGIRYGGFSTAYYLITGIRTPAECAELYAYQQMYHDIPGCQPRPAF